MAVKRSDVINTLMDLRNLVSALEKRLLITDRPCNETQITEAISMEAGKLLTQIERCTFTNGVDMHEVDPSCNNLYNGCTPGVCIYCGEGEE